MMSEATELVRYDAMCHAIAAAYEVDEVKDIRDKARAIEVYSRQAQNTEAERQACEIRLRAERKCGALLAEREMAKGTRGQLVGRDGSGGHISRPPEEAQSLADLGISKQQSSDWQKLADVPDDTFEAALSSTESPTTAGILRAHSEPNQPAVDPMALWLWGRLQDFDRDGVLDADPEQLLDSMLQHMKATTMKHVVAGEDYDLISEGGQLVRR
jgi:hypothetical protein